MNTTGNVFKLLLFVTMITMSSFQGSQRLDTETMSLELGNDGRLIGIRDIKSNRDYLAGATSSPLLSVRIDGIFYEPTSLEVSGDMLLLQFRQAGLSAMIRTSVKKSYLTLELVEISDPGKVELVRWGPFKTTIRETIGETIGVVRDSAFAIGIQALNPRTLGGYPENEDDSFTGYDIFTTTSLVDVADSVHIIYRGNAARPEAYGSSLNAYTRSRNTTRVVSSMQHEKYMAPAFGDSGIIGSRIALFGCPPEEVLGVIEEIELAEGLPHPLLGGEWAKRSRNAVSAYLIQDFTPDNYLKAIELTKKAGLKYLYHGDLFSTWGHFGLKYSMSWDDLAAMVDEAESQGIKVGAHTLSNFITTNDPYVTPVPDKRLARVGSSVLTGNITSADTSIGISDPAFFNQMKNNTLHAAMIGNELLSYEKVSDSEPWLLLGCERGAFGTTPSAFNIGDTIAKLADHAYKTFLTDNALSAEVAGRIAELYNRTGLKQISFDGLEGNSSTGMGKYGELLFVKMWYDNLSPEIKNDFIMDASTPGHYFWHMFTRMNWGEPWYAGFRESQTEYRLLNQDYFRRNYIPCMLGWFSMRPSTSIEDIEWMLARSAAFDAGYALVTNAAIVAKNGYGEEILAKIKEWERARMTGAFSLQQKKRMEKIKNEFTLRKTGENTWVLIPYEVRRYEHIHRDLQPGQPISTQITFNNPYKEQPVGFIITVKEGPASNITLEIGNHGSVLFPVEIMPGEYLKYEGGNEATLYTESWQIKKRVAVAESKLKIGKGDYRLTIDCDFPADDEGILKLELKTAGEPESVISKTI